MRACEDDKYRPGYDRFLERYLWGYLEKKHQKAKDWMEVRTIFAWRGSSMISTPPTFNRFYSAG
jgi:hypothetical protein